MIDVIRQQFKAGMSDYDKLNVTREFLQILTLKIMDEKKLFEDLAFLGGTSLRILFDLRRFSEDLDFSVRRKGSFDSLKLEGELGKSFRLYGLNFELKSKTRGAIYGMMMKFPGLLKELGLSPLVSEKLSIKLDVDTNPPSGGKTTNSLVNKIYLFNVTHYDLPSLYAGKLHACFYRKFTKGRDFYDFIWYLGRKATPNWELLNNSIQQTQGKALGLNEDNFCGFLQEKIRLIDFEQVKKDVERFLEDKGELALFNEERISSAIRNVYSK